MNKVMKKSLMMFLATQLGCAVGAEMTVTSYDPSVARVLVLERPSAQSMDVTVDELAASKKYDPSAQEVVLRDTLNRKSKHFTAIAKALSDQVGKKPVVIADEMFAVNGHPALVRIPTEPENLQDSLQITKEESAAAEKFNTIARTEKAYQWAFANALNDVDVQRARDARVVARQAVTMQDEANFGRYRAKMAYAQRLKLIEQHNQKLEKDIAYRIFLVSEAERAAAESQALADYISYEPVKVAAYKVRQDDFLRGLDEDDFFKESYVSPLRKALLAQRVIQKSGIDRINEINERLAESRTAQAGKNAIFLR